MTQTETTEQLNKIFINLIKETDVELFNKYKDDFFKILTALKFKKEYTIDMQIGLFEITCNDYIKTEFSIGIKKLLFDDFQAILINLNEATFD